ncbi:hypothetical protein FHX45_000665 [Amycolatopsis granulosa]|nr:hypothetical protein [Amycolatopsis granulosa]
MALAQRDFKRMIAYTSVNHMGYIILAVGAAGLVADSAAEASLWLDDAEKEALYDDFVSAIRKRLDHSPSPGRRRHLLATIMFPTEVTA